jgi:hypothetical protein
MYTIQFIFTFHSDKRNQIFTSYLPIPKEFLLNKTTLIAFAMLRLTNPQKANLIKISCSINVSKDKLTPLPNWYIGYNGKIWLDDLEAFRLAIDMPSSVDAEYVDNWMKNN